MNFDLQDGTAVRTGVTAILPRGRDTIATGSFAGWFSLNGTGEMTGTAYIDSSGFLEGPVMITGTHSVGAVHEGVIRWRTANGEEHHTGGWWSLPVVAETWAGLNDVNGFHVRPEHAMEALDRAASGPVAEGSAGGGTGMTCHGFKCGTGTSSRVVRVADQEFRVGVFVQANYGTRRLLRVAGVPAGAYLEAESAAQGDNDATGGLSSIIIVVATDAPLLPVQLRRLARRASLGLARNGSIASDGSGDIFLAFSTANADAAQGAPSASVSMLGNSQLNPLFEAVVNATEESIINSLVAGRTMTGHGGLKVPGIDVERLREILRRHGRLADDPVSQ